MIRAAGWLALVASGWAILSAAERTMSLDTAPPATPIAAGDPFELPGAIPISLLIRNDGDADDRLLGASTPAGDQIEMHCTRLIDGRRVMRIVPDGLAIPAGATIILEPGASHLMLVGLHVDLVQGKTFPLTLHFARAGEVTVTVRVRRRVDAAGITPFPPVMAGGISVSLASAPPAPAGTPTATPHP